MSASPATIGQNLSPSSPSPSRNHQIVVPARWRMGQFAVIAVIALIAIYYFTVGWKSGPYSSGKTDSRSLFDAVGFLILAALAWLTTPAAGVIATTTFQESVRRKWMAVLLVFGVVLLALSTFFTQFSPGAEEQFIRDFGIGFIIIITMLMAIFLGVSLVPPDIERRTIFTILSKPVTRLEFLIGKYLGLCLTMLVSLTLLSVMFLISYAIFKINREGWAAANVHDLAAQHGSLGFQVVNLGKALVLQFGQISILAALAMLLSLVVSNITAIVFCFVIYFGGQMSSFWEHLGKSDGGAAQPLSSTLAGPMQGVLNIVSLVLPKLDRFDVRQRLIADLPVEFNYMWKAYGTGFIYVAVLLIIAYLVFSDREF